MRGPAVRVRLFPRVVRSQLDLPSPAEVDNFRVPTRAQDNVARFEIAVHNSELVHVVDS